MWDTDALRAAMEALKMPRNAYMVLYFLLMVSIIVGADLLFLRHHLVARLITNVAIVAVFAAVYFMFLRRP